MTRKILVLGAGRGVGRATATALAKEGHDVIAVARTLADLETLAANASGISIEAKDASDEGAIVNLLQRYSPDTVLHIGGLKPKMNPLSAYSWSDFCAPWYSDTKMSFDLAQAALNGALPKGGNVIVFASGAALNGSPLSGGYAGAKRMQHFVMNYAQMEANKRDLGLTFTTIYPKQLIAGTQIASDASNAYGKMRGSDAASFMSQWDTPLTPESLANHVRGLVSVPQKGAFGVDGTDMVAMS